MTASMTGADWAIACTAIFVLGIAKSGLKGIGTVVVILMALVLGSKPSTGVVVPLLIFGDLFAIIYYHKHVCWKHTLRLLPWMLAGIITASFLGKDVPSRLFSILMAILIIASTVIIFWFDLQKVKKVPKSRLFGSLMGFMAGIATMIGNLAGAFSNVYFIAMQLPKNVLIGSAAWLYLFINVSKIPSHVWVWETIDRESLLLDVYLLPCEILGLLIGVRIVERIQNHHFVRYVLIMSVLGALALLLK